MVRRGVLVCVLLVGLGAAVGAQAPSSPSSPSTAGPTLSAEEAKDVEILSLKRQLIEATKMVADLQAAVGGCQGQLGPLQFQQNQQSYTQEQAALKARVEQRTGYNFDPGTGRFGPQKPPPDAKKPGGQ